MTYMGVIVLALDAQRRKCNDTEYMPLIFRFEALNYINYLEQYLPKTIIIYAIIRGRLHLNQNKQI